jgi:hypothetical protein
LSKDNLGHAIRVTTAEDLVLLKMALHRQNDPLDIPYLRHWSGQMLKEPAVRELDELIATYEADRPA